MCCVGRLFGSKLTDLGMLLDFRVVVVSRSGVVGSLAVRAKRLHRAGPAGSEIAHNSEPGRDRLSMLCV